MQRVPETETMGRVHTSTATVAILPQPDEVCIHVCLYVLLHDSYMTCVVFTRRIYPHRCCRRQWKFTKRTSKWKPFEQVRLVVLLIHLIFNCSFSHMSNSYHCLSPKCKVVLEDSMSTRQIAPYGLRTYPQELSSAHKMSALKCRCRGSGFGVVSGEKMDEDGKNICRK